MNSVTRWAVGLLPALLLSADAIGASATIPLDITASLNYDLWISNAEQAHAAVSNTSVAAVFGQHSIQYETSRSYAFQDQSGTGIGLPNDGLISKTVGDTQWNFAVCTNRGIVPDGGYTPTNRPTVANIAWKNTSPGTLPLTNRIDLVAAQQGRYVAANFLFNSSGATDGTYVRYIRIHALYATGAPQQVFNTDWVMSANWTHGADNPTNVVAYTVTRAWGISGSVSGVRTDTRYMHTFAAPLLLDDQRTLIGFDIVCRAAGVNRANHFHLYSISALPVDAPKTTLLVIR